MITPPPPPRVSRLSLPPLTRHRLATGLKVLILPDRRLPLSTVHLMLRTGSIDDPTDRAGLAELTAQMLRRGTAVRSAEQLSEAVDAAGLKLSVSADYELSHLRCRGRREGLDLCLELISEMITRPAFPAAEVKLLRRSMVAETHHSRDDPATLVELHFDHALFGSMHPAGRTSSEASLTRITRGDLARFHRRFMVPAAAALAVSGDVDPGHVRRRVAALFGPWAGGAPPARSTPKVAPGSPGPALLVDKPDLTQSYFAIGHPGIHRTHPMRDAARVLNHVLSGQRLTRQARSLGGKTYSIRSRFDIATADGSFIVKSFTRNAQLVNTLAIVRRELAEIRRRPPTAAEILGSRGRLAGGYALRFATTSSLAAALIQAELFELPVTYVTGMGLRISRLSAAEIRRAATLIDLDRAKLVIVGKGAVIGPQLEAAGIPFRKIDYMSHIGERPALPRWTHQDARITPAEQARARLLLKRASVAGGADPRAPRSRVSIRGRVRIIPEVSFASPPLEGTYSLRMEPAKGRLLLTMKLRAVGTKLEMTTTQALEGNRGYIVSGAGPRRPLPPARLDKLRQAMWRQPLLVLHNALGARSRPVVLPDLPKGRLAVEVLAAGHPPVTLILEERTHRLVQLRYRDDSGNVRRTDLSGHRLVSRVLVPHRMVSSRGKRVQTLIVEQISFE